MPEILEILKCSDCLSDAFTLTRQKFSNGTIHVAATCAACDKPKQYLKQDDPTVPATDPASYVMPYGKHKGALISEIPVDYVQWLADNPQPATKHAKAMIQKRAPSVARTPSVENKS